MLKQVLFIGAIMLGTVIFAQKKELTLKDAVSNQYRTYGPDRMNGFQWIPNTDCYTFFSKNYQTMFKSSVKNPKDQEATCK